MAGSPKSLLTIPVDSTSDAIHVVDVALHAGENTTDDRTYGGSAPASKLERTTTGAVKASAGKYYGVNVTVALSAAAITIYDNASAASGTVIDVIPASTAVGPRMMTHPIPCANGVYASFAGTGTVLFLYT